MSDLGSMSAAVMELPLNFYSGFFDCFFVLFFGAVFCLESGYGRPLLPPSLIASKSASVYIPDTPIYIYGFFPNRCSLLLTAAVDIPNRCENTKTVKGIIFSSISSSIYRKQTANQVQKRQNVYIFGHLLHRRIVKFIKFSKFYENSFQNLDKQIKMDYFIYRLYVYIYGHIEKKNGFRRHREPKRQKAEGDFYERESKVQQTVGR